MSNGKDIVSPERKAVYESWTWESHFPSLTPGILPGTRGVRLDWQLHNVFHQNQMATHSSILAWKIPWTEEHGGLQSRGHEESDTTERLTTCPCMCCHMKPHLLHREAVILFLNGSSAPGSSELWNCAPSELPNCRGPCRVRHTLCCNPGCMHTHTNTQVKQNFHKTVYTTHF